MKRKDRRLAKTEVIRINAEDRQLINDIKLRIGMNSSNNEGDVIHEMVKMFVSKKIGDQPFLVRSPKIDLNQIINKATEYKNAYEIEIENRKNSDLKALRWKERFEFVCKRTNTDQLEIMGLVK